MTTILLALLLILGVSFGFGISVAVAMGLGGTVLGWIFTDRPIWDILGEVPWNVMTSEPLVALPLFILMGEILLRSGITDRMYENLTHWLNRLPGGLLHTNVVACAVFSCISGSSAATAATIGSVSMPALRRFRYNERLALGSLAAGGTLGILIPPSITFIVYAVLVQESIGQLYIAALIPGVLMTLSFMTVIYIAAKRNPAIAPSVPNVSWRKKLEGLRHLLPIIVLIFLVLGTIYTGVATASEAAAFGVTGALLLTLVTGRLNAAMLKESLVVTSTTTAMIMFILVGAFVLQFVLAFLGIPAALSRWITELGLSALQLVLMVCVIYLVLGSFMEELSMVVTTIPVLVPLFKSLGVDMVWFGVIVVILVQAAIISPPVGMNLFVLQGMRNRLSEGGAGRPISDIFIGVTPFFLAMVVTLALVIFFPQITTWLVDLSRAK
jgi:tripartite ATP-independent transporter DctM subunit